jgi:hypothetical protein
VAVQGGDGVDVYRNQEKSQQRYKKAAVIAGKSSSSRKAPRLHKICNSFYVTRAQLPCSAS